MIRGLRRCALRWTICSLGALSAVWAQDSKLVFPAKEWESIKPEAAGYSSEKLNALRSWLKTQQTTALHVSVGGRVIFEYGDAGRVSKIFSARKSVLAMLYGKYVAQGKINLDSTVEQLGLADVQPFLPVEKGATLRQLLTARSGIYLPTANKELTEASPRRGSQAPGTYFQYQNWDFNAAGTAFEKLTEKDIFVALEEDLAKPIEWKTSTTSFNVRTVRCPLRSTRNMRHISRQGTWRALGFSCWRRADGRANR